jgi:hypothetical protein
MVGHFVLVCLLSWSKYMVAPFCSKEVALSRFSLSCVSVQHQRVFNSNNGYVHFLYYGIYFTM